MYYAYVKYMAFSPNTTLSFYNIFPHNLYLHLFTHRHIQRCKINRELLRIVSRVNTDFIGLKKTHRFGALAVLY
jgi:hypothetical protein